MCLSIDQQGRATRNKPEDKMSSYIQITTSIQEAQSAIYALAHNYIGTEKMTELYAKADALQVIKDAVYAMQCAEEDRPMSADTAAFFSSDVPTEPTAPEE